MSALAERLHGILNRPQPSPFLSPSDAQGWLELAYDRAYAEDHDGAIRAAEAGIAAEGADAEAQLSLWGIAASVHHLADRDEAALECAHHRVELLRRLGRNHQADLEEDLGSLLFREPRPEEAPLLEAALATHSAAGASAEVLADIRLPLAVCRVEAGDETALEDLELCAEDYRAGGRIDSLAGALLYLAHHYARGGRFQEALEKSDELLALPVNRAMRAAVWMVRATGHNELGNPLEAEGSAVEALDLYAAAGVRRGAVSAAALVANLAAQAEDQEAAVLAWRIAVQQAERGEFGEVWAVRMGLGNQLLEAGEYLLAEEVLEHLAGWLEQAGRTADQARTLMSLGHCLRHQERQDEALAAWERASELFAAADLPGEASRALLSAGTLLAREGRDAEGLKNFERAVMWARRAGEEDPAALPQALHAFGHAQCEAGDADGLAALDEAIRLADEHSAEWHSADFRDTRARSLWLLGHGREAVSAALEAADLYRDADDPDGSGNAELFAAQVLFETGQLDQAARVFRLIAEEHRGSPAHHHAAQRGLSEVLDAMGLREQAEEARAAAEAALDAGDTAEDTTGEDGTAQDSTGEGTPQEGGTGDAQDDVPGS
ncbi:hypothetical protein NCCP1664_02650 [Zafaria cholistanensis]|uniref:Tetratricopeptide repeat protein n=1 Tax=Zafaria cholistanensis TaxID=1682741 RepID=A0A5A7NPQ8_9MICC|nr:hypothetical protein [Zafaria cholistanensis]GER21768.1 hypothetical protein NCCP1664_02650 [Zafaria cholistanensis]